MTEATLDPGKQEQAREYAHLRRRLLVADLALAGVYVILWLVGGWSIDLRNYLSSLTTNEWLVVAGFMLVFGGIYFLIDLPLSYYSGYILPHRYDLSTQSLGGWILDMLKGVLVGGVLGLIVIEIIYFVLRISPDLWWLWAGLILLFFNVILANLAPVLLLPLFYKFVPLEEEHADLVARLIDLAEKAGTQVRGVYKFDMSRRTKAANAAITGLGNTRRIILGDTLINEFTDDEIETVLAHELGHQVHHDIPIGIVVESVITLGGLYLASLALQWGVGVFGFESVSDVAAMPLLALVIGIYGLVTMPLGNAYSRQREVRADEYALQVTGKGTAYASALTRLANQNLAEADPEPWVEKLLYSHPALSKRIAMAENYDS
jgi:STE24 endopeptidase